MLMGKLRSAFSLLKHDFFKPFVGTMPLKDTFANNEDPDEMPQN